MSYFKMTLRNWISYKIPNDEILYNTSLHPDDKKELNLKDDGFIKEPIGVSLSITKDILRQINFIESNELNINLIYFAFRTNTDKNRTSAETRKTNINRETIINTLKKKGYSFPMLPPKEYIKSLLMAKFCPSPEGNGIDCHRHWESLYCKTIPIIEHNEKMKTKLKNLPVIYTIDYSEINDEYLNEKYNEMLDIEYDFSSLFLSYYNETEKNKIIKRSLYWGRRYNKPDFY